ncbi:MAG: hypothetical protein R2762_24525 [Bryobacteraceae bacterium]
MQPEAVRAHLQTILASEEFANAQRIRRFLEYTVEMALRGESAQIKEFLLGREVFDRGGDYDPRLDPIVRVEARRLRQRLEEYYTGAGRSETIRIEYPKGSYAPLIRPAELPAAGAASGRRWRGAAAFVLLACAAAGTATLLMRTGLLRTEPAIAVVPARWVWKDTAGLDGADEALAESITARLANSGRVPVIGWPVLASHRGSWKQIQEMGKDLGARDITVVAARREAGTLRVTVFLMEATSGRKRWVEDFAGDDAEAMAAHIASALPR